MPNHDQIVAAAAEAVQIEERLEAIWSFVSRLRWLTEAELASRIHTHLTSSAVVSPASIRMSAQGKKQVGGTNHDIEFYTGTVLTGAVEVLYCFAAQGEDSYQPQQANCLNDDVNWLLAERRPQVRHVVAFFPRMIPGYTVQKNPRAFGLDGQAFDRPENAVLLTGVLQATALEIATRELLTDVFVQVPNPAVGNEPRWSLVARVLPGEARVTGSGVQLTRSVVKPEGGRLWAVVFTRS